MDVQISWGCGGTSFFKTSHKCTVLKAEVHPLIETGRSLGFVSHSVLRTISHDGVIRNGPNDRAITWGCHRGVMRSLGQVVRSLGQVVRSLGRAISWTHGAISWAGRAIVWASRWDS